MSRSIKEERVAKLVEEDLPKELEALRRIYKILHDFIELNELSAVRKETADRRLSGRCSAAREREVLTQQCEVFKDVIKRHFREKGKEGRNRRATASYAHA